MADNRNFEGELTKAISGSLVVGRVVVMMVAIAIGSVAVYAFGKLAMIKVGWLFWLNYTIAGIGWVLAAYFVLSGMVSVCKMALARETGQGGNTVTGIVGIFSNLFVVFFATLRYLFWFVAVLVLAIWAVGFLGRIPEAGPILYGIVPLGIISMCAALWIAVHVAKFFGNALILPGIIASTGQKAVSCFREGKRVINGQPVRLVKRFLSIGLVIVLFSFVVAQGLAFFATHARAALSGKNAPVIGGAPAMRYLPTVPSYAPLPVVTRVQMGSVLPPAKATGTRVAGAWFLTIEFMVLLLILKAIGANLFALAGMSTYQALKDEPAASITAPDLKVPDLGKMKGSLGAVGAKFREEMREGGEEKKAPPKKEG